MSRVNTKVAPNRLETTDPPFDAKIIKRRLWRCARRRFIRERAEERRPGCDRSRDDYVLLEFLYHGPYVYNSGLPVHRPASILPSRAARTNNQLSISGPIVCWQVIHARLYMLFLDACICTEITTGTHPYMVLGDPDIETRCARVSKHHSQKSTLAPGCICTRYVFRNLENMKILRKNLKTIGHKHTQVTNTREKF